MFICTPCLTKKYWNEPSFRVSFGKCEDCGASAECSDIHQPILRLKFPQKKFVQLKVYALTLDMPYGGGLAIVIAKNLKDSIRIANNDQKTTPTGGVWVKPEKLPLQTKSKKSKVIAHKYHFE